MKFSEIVSDETDSDITKAFDDAQAASDFEALPSGTYTAHIVAGELSKSKKKGTPSYKLTFRVIEGEHEGRQFWHDIWLTKTAMPMAKRDLAKLGVTKLEQLDNELPAGIRCEVKLAQRTSDDGAQFNRLRRFDVLGIDDDPNADEEFAPEGGDA